MKYDLNGIWSLEGRRPADTSPVITLTAHVPGNLELDLQASGLEPDPYWGENEYRFHKYETWSWTYSRSFSISQCPDGCCELVFGGLNCIADVFLDDKFLGHFENALIEHRIALDPLVPGAHTLRVVVHSAILHARNADYPAGISQSYLGYEYTRLRMPPHSFGWDIMPRFLSAGIWRDVYLEWLPEARLTQTYFAVRRATEARADITYKYRFVTPDADLSGYRIRVSLDGKEYADLRPYFTAGEISLNIDRPRLWWPRGYGNPETYTLTSELIKNDTVLFTKTETVGIREIEIVHKMAAGEDGEFLVRVNSCPILAKGANWVPLDAMHSRDSARYEKAISLFCESNCNILRLWGGNVYEDTALMELCDRSGILVWHDFAMACALYPQDDAFAQTIYEEAQTIIRKHRNHPCILLWSGDNEVDETYVNRAYMPEENRYNLITREVLPRAVRENDPYRMFLPSSPYLSGGLSRYEVPEQHLWGPRAYYKDDFYRLTKAHFISECGYHGCPALCSLQRFIPAEELKDMRSGSWTAHNSDYTLLTRRGYDRNQLMRDQVELMFGCVPEDLEEFVLLSQFVQAEAKKFFIENTRLNKWKRTGIIWWNMLDGWPQISDSVVDWYFEKKRAFHAIRRVQEPICVIADEPSGWEQRIILCNDSRRSAEVPVKVYDADTGEILCEDTYFSPANENRTVCSFRTIVSRKRLLIMEWMLEGKKYKNHYLCGYPVFSPEDARRWSEIIDREP